MAQSTSSINTKKTEDTNPIDKESTDNQSQVIEQAEDATAIKKENASNTNSSETSSNNTSDDVVIVKSQKQYNHSNQNEKEEKSENKSSEKAINYTKIPSLISIKFDENRYLPIKYKKEEFALYEVSICTDTESKTSWKLFLRYSDIICLHQQLEFHYNSIVKHKPALKNILTLPQVHT